MKKILLVNSGMRFNSELFGKSLARYFDVSLTGVSVDTQYGYEIDEDFFNSHYIGPEELRDLNQYDYIMGLEHGSIRILLQMQQRFSKPKYGTQILDYPMHVFRKDKNYNEGATLYWRFLRQHLNRLDFTFHNMSIGLDNLQPYLNPKGKHMFLKYPVNPVRFEDYERKDFIIYSGRMHADKGIHYVLSALSLIDESERPKFIAIGSGFDFQPLAEHLKIKYKNIIDCSEKEKWKLYYESRFLICGADNPYIPALSIAEGISVNRAGVVFDYEECHKHYERYAWYVPPANIASLSNTIKCMYKDKDLCDSRASEGHEYYNNVLSYDAWGDSVKKAIDEVR